MVHNRFKAIAVLIPLIMILMVSCQPLTTAKSPAENLTDNASQRQQPPSHANNITLQSGFEIPQGKMPQREATYDDIVNCAPGSMNYRANCKGQLAPGYIKEAQVTLSGCEFAPRITYRDYIETRAGQVRINILYAELQDESQCISCANQYLLKQTLCVYYSVKLATIIPDIKVSNLGVRTLVRGFFAGEEQIYLMIEVPSQVKAGNYALRFIIEANGQRCGELPCVIHVIE